MTTETQTVMTILKGHTTPDTAYTVADYPYGFRLRCKIRYWLEVDKKRGVRLVSQTINPKRGDVWNKPKASTYSRFGGCMYLDANQHVQWSGLSQYGDAAEVTAWLETYGAGNVIPEVTASWLRGKVAYEAKVASGVAWNSAEAIAAAMVATAKKPTSNT